MKPLAVGLVFLAVAATTTASSAFDITRLPKPPFPAPVPDVDPGDPQLVLRSSRYHSPGDLPPSPPAPPAWAAKRFRGEGLLSAIRQTRPRLVFLVYGSGGSGRYLVATDSRTHEFRYAIDFVRFMSPPGGGEIERSRGPARSARCSTSSTGT